MATSLRVMNSHVAHKPPCFALAMRRQSIVLPGRRLLWPWEFVYYRGDCLEVREFERALSLEVTYFFFFLTFTFWASSAVLTLCVPVGFISARSERILNTT